MDLPLAERATNLSQPVMALRPAGHLPSISVVAPAYNEQEVLLREDPVHVEHASGSSRNSC